MLGPFFMVFNLFNILEIVTSIPVRYMSIRVAVIYPGWWSLGSHSVMLFHTAMKNLYHKNGSLNLYFLAMFSKCLIYVKSM